MSGDGRYQFLDEQGHSAGGDRQRAADGGGSVTLRRGRRQSSENDGTPAANRRQSMPDFNIGSEVRGIGAVARDRRASTFAVPDITNAKLMAETEEDWSQEDDYMFPLWWFIVIQGYSISNAIFASALWGIVWPHEVGRIYGYQDKALALAAVDNVNHIINLASPFVGSLSDRFPERLAKHVGRRRPFIFVGQLIGAFGVWMSYKAMYWPGGKGNNMLLLASLIVGNVGGTLMSTPFSAIPAETIHPKQRGVFFMLSGYMGFFSGLLGNGVGYMVGQKIFFTDEMIWLIVVGMFFFQIPLLMLACGGTAGWCTPERRKAQPANAVADSPFVTKDKSKIWDPLQVRKPRFSLGPSAVLCWPLCRSHHA